MPLAIRVLSTSGHISVVDVVELAAGLCDATCVSFPSASAGALAGCGSPAAIAFAQRGQHLGPRQAAAASLRRPGPPPPLTASALLSTQGSGGSGPVVAWFLGVPPATALSVRGAVESVFSALARDTASPSVRARSVLGNGTRARNPS